MNRSDIANAVYEDLHLVGRVRKSERAVAEELGSKARARDVVEAVAATLDAHALRGQAITAAQEVLGDRARARAAVAAMGLFDNRAHSLAVIDAVVAAITRGLVEEGRVHVTGLGSFIGEQVPSRMVRNPATGGRQRAKKSGRVKFRPSLDLKEYLAGRAKLPRQQPTR